MPKLHGRTWIDTDDLLLHKAPVTAVFGDLNTAPGKLILAGRAGYKIIITGFIIRIGAADLTGVTLLVLEDGAGTDIVTMAVANTVANAIFTENAAATGLTQVNVNVALGEGKGVFLYKTGGTAAGGGDMTVELTYKMIRA